jgi:agmatine deiminase
VLRAVRTADGRPLEIVTLAEPEAIRSDDPDFVSSYVNYYVCNGAVIMPEFGDAHADAAARATLASLYPGRQMVQLNIDALGASGGGIHCATQQQPQIPV